NAIDADLHLIDTNGTTELVADDLDGRGFCPLIDGTGSVPRDAAAVNNTTADKQLFISVDGFDNTDVFGYRLVVTIRVARACGDGETSVHLSTNCNVLAIQCSRYVTSAISVADARHVTRVIVHVASITHIFDSDLNIFLV